MAGLAWEGLNGQARPSRQNEEKKDEDELECEKTRKAASEEARDGVGGPEGRLMSRSEPTPLSARRRPQSVLQNPMPL